MLSLEFIHWLDGYLEAVPANQELDAEKTANIRNRLNNIFRHEIDPEQDRGRDAESLRRAHSGEFALPQLPSGELTPLSAVEEDFISQEPEKDMC